MAEFMSARELHWKAGDQQIACRIEESKGHGTFYVSGSSLPFRIVDSAHIEINGKHHRFYVIHRRDASIVWLNGRTYYLQRAGKASGTPAAASSSTGEVRALMPGKLLRLEVAVGDTVIEKQTVAAMESMKMESSLLAPKSGRVSEIRYTPGDVVEMNEIVIVIES